MRNIFTLLKARQRTTIYSRSSSTRPCEEVFSTRAEDEHLLCSLCERGHIQKALSLLSSMETSPSNSTYLCFLKTCNRKKDLLSAKQVYHHITGTKNGTDLSGFLGDYLVVTLSRCGDVEEAVHVSHSLARRTVFSWTAIISAYVDCGHAHKALQMYGLMLDEGIDPDSHTFVSLLKVCGSIQDLKLGKKLHSEAKEKGFLSDVFVGNSLITMYGRCGRVSDAEDVFLSMPSRDIISWNAMLLAFVDQCQGEKGLRLYRQMLEESKEPDSRTLMSILQALGGHIADMEKPMEKASDKDREFLNERDLEIGQALHAYAKRKGLLYDVFVGNALVSMYGKCGAIKEAESLLVASTRQDVVSWTSMLSACIEQNEGEKGLHYYMKMLGEGVNPDELTFVATFQACSILVDKQQRYGQSSKEISLEIAKALKIDFDKQGFSFDNIMANTLINVYGKCRAVVEAEELFAGIACPDVVTWSVMFSVYAESGLGDKASHLYKRIQAFHPGVILTEATLMSILKACCNTGNLDICEEIHFILTSANYDQIPSISATLIHAYGKCACMLDAFYLFDHLHAPDIVAWTSCCAGHAEDGNFVKVGQMFRSLVLFGISPDEVMFASALTACNHSGLFDAGLQSFVSMARDYNIVPNMKHYAILLDLLGRTGNFGMIENVLKRMPVGTDLSLWLGLLGACGRHTNLHLAQQVFVKALVLQPEEATTYVMMSNIYAQYYS